ncbi:MAG: hypothetical protein LW830_01845 [Phenylobacterium sp.]|nr:hypothetical protein [Phenylobacterium sp.]
MKKSSWWAAFRAMGSVGQASSRLSRRRLAPAQSPAAQARIAARWAASRASAGVISPIRFTLAAPGPRSEDIRPR